MPSIVGIGLVALDLIVEHDESGVRTSASGGGTCGNVLAILARLGWEATWLGEIGNTAAGREVALDLQASGVRVASRDARASTPIFAHHLRQQAGAAPEHWFSTVCPFCEHDLPKYTRPHDDWLSALGKETTKCDVFFCDRLSDATVSLAALAKANGAIVVYEPSSKSDAPWIGAMLGLADVVKYSHHHSSIVHGSRRPDILWIETHGAEGLRWSRHTDSGHMEWIDPVPAPIVRDSCGAGDWFTSALIFQLGRAKQIPSELSDAHVRATVTKASEIASWSCAYLGARGGLYDASPQALYERFGLGPAPSSQLKRPSPIACPVGWPK